MARGRRRRAGALPRVDPDVVVVVAGGEEGGVEATLATVGGHAEPEGVAVERERAVEIGDAEVDVADPDGRVDGFGVHAGSVPVHRPPGHRCIHLTGRAQARIAPWTRSHRKLVGRAREREAIAGALAAAARAAPAGCW